MPPKGKKKRDCRATVFVVDVSLRMSALETTEETALQTAKSIITWVVSRNIFNETGDVYGLVHTCEGIDSDVNSRNEEVESASIDFLKYIDLEVKVDELADDYDYFKSLNKALELIERCDDESIIEKSIIFLCNASDPLPEGERTDDFIRRVEEAECKFAVVGRPQGVVENNDLPYLWMKFNEALDTVSCFRVKDVTLRQQKFPLYVDHDRWINVAMLKKYQTAKPNLKLDYVDGITLEKLKKTREIVEAGASDLFDRIDRADEHEQPSTSDSTANKEIAWGFRYGRDLVIFNKEDLEAKKPPREPRSLKLIAFSPKKCIYPELIMEAGWQVLPLSGNPEDIRAFSVLVDAMLRTDTVALVRYVYNSGSNPKLAALIPKMSKKRYRKCSLAILPFYQDVRMHDFPPLLKTEFNDHEMQTMKAFVEAMTLRKDEFVTTKIRNPMIQKTYSTLLHFALLGDSDEKRTLPDVDWLKDISPKEEMLEKCADIEKALEEQFPLHHMEKVKFRPPTLTTPNLEFKLEDLELDPATEFPLLSETILAKMEDEQSKAPLQNIKFESIYVYKSLITKSRPVKLEGDADFGRPTAAEHDPVQAIEQTTSHVKQIIKTSIEFETKDQQDRAMKFMGEWRSAVVEYKCPATYNAFAKELVDFAQNNKAYKDFIVLLMNDGNHALVPASGSSEGATEEEIDVYERAVKGLLENKPMDGGKSDNANMVADYDDFEAL